MAEVEAPSPVHVEPIHVVQGATFDWEFQWTVGVFNATTQEWEPGPAVPIGHMSARLQIRKGLKNEVWLDASTVSKPDSTPVNEWPANGMVILGQGTDPDDPETGRIRFLWSGEETMKVTGKGIYDFELYDDTETPMRTQQLIRGPVSVTLNVTREDA